MEVATGKLFKLKSPPTVVKGRVEYKADSSAMADFMKTNVSVFSLSKYIDVFQNATLLGYKRICFLAVQNSSIGDLVTDSVTHSLTH